MGMRIVWGLHDTNFEELVALFEAENLLVDYREQLLRQWFDQQTVPLSGDGVAMTSDERDIVDDYNANRTALLDLGYERWRNSQINELYPRWITKKYELWNSVPPNPERLVMHFDS